MQFFSSFEFYLHLAGIILVVVTIALAVRLISLVGKARTWLLFGAALVLLAVDRVVELFRHAGILFEPHTYAIVSDILGLGIIGCLFGSTFFIRDLFVGRKLVEEAISKQQELTSQIIETIPMRVFWKDRDLRFCGCNTLFAQDAGLTRPDDLIGKTDFDMEWKDQAEQYRAADRRVIDTDAPVLFTEEPQTTPKGKRIWLYTSKVPLHGVDHEVIGILGVYDEITEARETELRLQESEERYRKSFQNSAIGMSLVGLDGSWLRVNDSLCRIVGYSEQELLATTFQDITHPDDLQPSLDLVARLLAEEIDHYEIEKRYFHKDGHDVWVRLSVSLARDAHDKPFHFVAQIEDITESREMRSRLQESEKRFRQIAETTSDCVWQTDEYATYVYMSPRIRDILGYEPEEVQGKSPVDFMSADEGERVAALFESIAGTQVAFSFIENTNIHKDGHRVFLESSGVPIVGSDGTFQGYFGTNRDISERKKAEEELWATMQKSELLFESSRDALVIAEPPSWMIVRANQAALQLFGASSLDELTAIRSWGISPERQPGGRLTSERIPELIATTMREGACLYEWEFLKLDGRPFPGEVLMTCMEVDGEVLFLASVRDISERKKAEEKIHLLATTDSLTGIANRREFSAMLDREVARATRYDSPLSLAMFDLDYFKRVNDTFGHDVGDSVLLAVTELVKGSIRSVDVVARWGGDEFMVLMPQSKLQAAESTSEKLRLAIAEHEFDKVGKVTASFGVATFEPQDDVNSLLKRTDDALYLAKDKGRNRVETLTGETPSE